MTYIPLLQNNSNDTTRDEECESPIISNLLHFNPICIKTENSNQGHNEPAFEGFLRVSSNANAEPKLF